MLKRTLSSLAMISALWDRRRADFLQCMVPFLGTLLHTKRYSKIEIEVLCRDFEAEFGLTVPYHPMVALVNRGVKRGLLVKAHGQMHTVPQVAAEENVSGEAATTLQTFAEVIGQLQEFAKETFSLDWAAEQAEAALLSFLGQYDSDVLSAGQGKSVLPVVKAKKQDHFVACSFVTQVGVEGSSVRQAIDQVAVGHVMAAALTYGDIDRYRGSPSKVSMYLDTRFILRLLGFEGEFRKEAYAGLARLMSRQGRLHVFPHTMDEVMNALRTAERYVGSAQYDPRKASPVAAHFAEQGCTASDLGRAIVKVPGDLRDHGISTSLAPDPNVGQEYQVDESALRESIKKNRTAPERGREFSWLLGLDRDIRSLSYVHKLRKGVKAHSVRQSGHLFVTTNARLARACRDFEKSQGIGGPVSACVTDVFLGTVLFAESPAEARDIVTKNLVASCYAALRPDAELIGAYVDKLEGLKKEDAISPGEFYFMRGHHTALQMLAFKTLGSAANFSDATLRDIIDEMRRELTADLRADRDAVAAELARVTREANAERLAHMDKNARLAATCRKVSGLCAWALCILLILGCIVGCYFALPSLWTGDLSALAVTGMVINTLVGLAGTVLMVAGGLRARLGRKLSRRLCRVFGVEDSTPRV